MGRDSIINFKLNKGNKMKNKLSVVTLLVLAVIGVGLTLSFTGCSTSGAGTRQPVCCELGRVAILPFENLSSEPNAGLIIMRNMDCAFRKYSKLDILDMTTMRSMLEIYDGEYLSPVKLGERLGVDSVITGAVTEYRYVYGAGEQPVVGLNIQIISVATGETIWAEQASSTGNMSWIREQSLAEVAEEITISLAKNFQRVYNPGE